MKGIMRAGFYLTFALGAVSLILSVVMTLGVSSSKPPSTPELMTSPAPTRTYTVTPTPIPKATPTPTLTPWERANERQVAVVYIYMPGSGSQGSGSIVSREGLILTNFHVVGDTETGQLYNDEGVAQIAVTTLPYGQADPRYQAKVLVEDPDLDLAVLQIVAAWDGEPLQGGLDLMPVLLGDSNTLAPPQDIFMLGYPGTGGLGAMEVSDLYVTISKGVASGWVSEKQPRDWIKTDAEISGGNSGGMAINTRGELIGVPTRVELDEVGGVTRGKLGYVRPINMAKPLIDRARDKMEEVP